MCGFAGQLVFSERSNKVGMDKNILIMTRSLKHRGPDGEGFWNDNSGLIYLGHRRLSILDISEAGSQPFQSADGRYILAYNGEIYNHKNLRKKLEDFGYDFSWESNCDTETLMASIMTWGIDKSLKEINGMFAFALWDKKEKRLTLCRDKMGIKPLYYGFSNGDLLFASELRAIKSHPEFKAKINKNALALYLRHCYVPTPYSIYEGIHKLEPGHYISFGIESNNAPKPVKYWNLSAHFFNNNLNTALLDPEKIINNLENKIEESIKLRMTSDVPIGAFLSGGIDSSLIVSLMQKISPDKINTFTIGFENNSFNEAVYAKKIAEHLQTNHTELYIKEKESLNLAYNCSSAWDEPFGDSSQIPMLLLSSLTSGSVKVALSGDGGDEFFCGYNRYVQGYNLFKLLSLTPTKIRKIISSNLGSINSNFSEKIDYYLYKFFKLRGIQDKILKLSQIIDIDDKNLFYRKLISCIYEPCEFLISGIEPKTIMTSYESWPKVDDFREIMMYLDSATYLVDDILTKVDRATMSYGLEARVPFLDSNLIEFATSIPMDLKNKKGTSKWILKEILKKYVPKDYFVRPKMGFGVPLANWLKGPLRDWTFDLLNESSIKKQGLFNPIAIKNILRENYSGNRYWHYQIWTLLMFQSWYYNSHLKD